MDITKMSENDVRSVEEEEEEQSKEETDVLSPEQPSKTSIGRFCTRSLEDKQFRHKYLHTGCVCMAMLCMGWRQSMTGPTLPDLRLIIKEDLGRASWLISALAFGALAGSPSIGAIYDRFNKRATLGGLTLCLALCSLATPWCDTFAAMVTVHMLTGVCAGGIDTVVSADIVNIWRQKSAPFLQTVNLAFSVGAIMSPVVLEPFLAERLPPEVTNTSFIRSTMVGQNGTIDDALKQKRNLSLLNFTDEGKSSEILYGTTHIYWAYAISAIVCLLAFFSFVAGHFCLGNIYIDEGDKSINKGGINSVASIYLLSRNWKIFFILMLSIMLSVYVISERHLHSYLVTFLVERMFWTKTRASNATVVFWSALAIGRTLSVIIVKLLTLFRVIALCLGLNLTSGIVFVLAIRLPAYNLVWVACVLYGLGMSALYGSIFTWVSTNVCRLTGKISSVMYTINMVGVMVFPLVTGDVMSSVSYDWFIYLEIILTCVMMVIISTTEILFRVARKNRRT